MRNAIPGRTSYIIPEPLSAQDWSRFQFYALLIRDLDHGDDGVDPSALSLLHRHAGGGPIFPNLLSLKWELSTPGLTWVVTPTLQDLFLTYAHPGADKLGEEYIEELDTDEPIFSETLLPAAFRNLPALDCLRLPRLRHSSRWLPLVPEPGGVFAISSLRFLSVGDTLRILMDGGLAAISAIPSLVWLQIKRQPRMYLGDFEPVPTWDMTPIRVFENLEGLEIEGSMTEGVALIDAIIAPKLQFVELTRVDRDTLKVPCLPGLALATLGSRNATSLTHLTIELRCANIREPFWSEVSDKTMLA